MSSQQGLTIITRVRAGREAALRELLVERIAVDLEGNALVPFGRLGRVHFARWFVLDPSGGVSVPCLVFSSCFDGTARSHLEELLAVAGAGVAEIYGHCEGCPPDEDREGRPPDGAPSAPSPRAALLDYLERHRVPIHTLYIGTRGLTVERIRRDAELHETLQELLDTALPADVVAAGEATSIRAALQELVRAREGHGTREGLTPPAPDAEPRRRFWPMPRDLIPLGLIVLVAAAFVALWITVSFGAALVTALVAALALFLVGGWTLRAKELLDPEAPASADARHVRGLTEHEDRIVQNQLSSITDVKPGRFRLALLRSVLLIIDMASRYRYTEGRLGTIGTIHYARWIVIDGGRRLLFLSNFDGSWESYLGDFIDKASSGLSAIWSNTDGFPRTRWLTRGGARDEQRFKAYTRTSQVRTEVWYSAYRYLTVVDVRRNAAIREGLSGARDEAAAADWLALL